MAFEQTIKNLDNCLRTDTFTGKDDKALPYVIATMNMILHGVECPNIINTNTLTENLADVQKDFVDYILKLYIKEGSEELAMDKLPVIIAMKYGGISDGINVLGGIDTAKNVFLNFQKSLYLS